MWCECILLPIAYCLLACHLSRLDRQVNFSAIATMAMYRRLHHWNWSDRVPWASTLKRSRNNVVSRWTPFRRPLCRIIKLSRSSPFYWKLKKRKKMWNHHRRAVRKWPLALINTATWILSSTIPLYGEMIWLIHSFLRFFKKFRSNSTMQS